MDLEEFQWLYPDFQLEDELIVQGGRDVMWGIPYGQRKKKAQAQAGACKARIKPRRQPTELIRPRKKVQLQQ
jgi:hypothetical protein